MKKRNLTDMIDELEENELVRYDYAHKITKYKSKSKRRVIINAPAINILGRKIRNYLVELLKTELLETFNINKYKNICVVGLGNRDIINDALGPKVLQKLLVTRGLDVEPQLCIIFPNVYSKTGIESADLVKCVCEKVKPDLVILIDALTTASIDRLGSSFQITDEGIQAGSGNRSDNKRMTKKFLNCEVVSIGVPMLVYAEKFIDKKLKNNNLKDLILSPCDTKKILNLLSDIISQSLNYAIFPQFTSEEIDVLID